MFYNRLTRFNGWYPMGSYIAITIYYINTRKIDRFVKNQNTFKGKFGKLFLEGHYILHSKSNKTGKEVILANHSPSPVFYIFNFMKCF